MGNLRRRDAEVTDRDRLLAWLDRQTHGCLAYLRHDGSPGIVSLNFARVGGQLVFHGAREGEKAHALVRGAEVSFMVAEPLALLPSYLFDRHLACPATNWYRSVVIRGRVEPIEHPAAKAAALQALMQKLQPEGGYEPVADTERYAKSLASTAVFALPLDEMTGKFKLGQNLPRVKRAMVARFLRERDGAVDRLTLAAMAEMGLLEHGG